MLDEQNRKTIRTDGIIFNENIMYNHKSAVESSVRKQIEETREIQLEGVSKNILVKDYEIVCCRL